ncbi:MAG: ribosomal subunit interface protein [Planctomycetota bacterium]|jgi:ribosomal subunit interface protein
MIIQVNYGDIKKTDAIDDYVHERVNKELAHIADRITRVEVHLHDDNSAHKSGADDKRCTMEARPAGRQPLAVEHKSDEVQRAISEAAGKLARALTKAFEKAK